MGYLLLSPVKRNTRNNFFQSAFLYYTGSQYSYIPFISPFEKCKNSWNLIIKIVCVKLEIAGIENS